jgi:LmbE family N-acetylglucosaminyl deacetylase
MLKLSHADAEVFVPDGEPPDTALARTTHLGVGAHPDDLELMAAHGILECFQRADRWFCGVVVGDGAGSPRAHEYENYSDERMKAARRLEQKKAACVGEYGAQILLAHTSAAVKDPAHAGVLADLTTILRAARPELVYTHNLADKHDTHVAVALRVIAACRALPADERPLKVIGCEAWRDLDWLLDGDKVAMPLDGREALQAALIGVFDSQIAGGKRYDLATSGRRRAHATYFDAGAGDRHAGLIWGMDLTPLVEAAGDPETAVAALIRRFESDVRERIRRLS